MGWYGPLQPGEEEHLENKWKHARKKKKRTEQSFGASFLLARWSSCWGGAGGAAWDRLVEISIEQQKGKDSFQKGVNIWSDFFFFNRRQLSHSIQGHSKQEMTTGIAPQSVLAEGSQLEAHPGMSVWSFDYTQPGKVWKDRTKSHGCTCNSPCHTGQGDRNLILPGTLTSLFTLLWWPKVHRDFYLLQEVFLETVLQEVILNPQAKFLMTWIVMNQAEQRWGLWLLPTKILTSLAYWEPKVLVEGSSYFLIRTWVQCLENPEAHSSHHLRIWWK